MLAVKVCVFFLVNDLKTTLRDDTVGFHIFEKAACNESDIDLFIDDLLNQFSHWFMCRRHRLKQAIRI